MFFPPQMNLTFFRSIDSNPPRIELIDSTTRYVVLVHSDTILSFHSPQNLGHLFSFEVDHKITAIHIFNEEFLIIGLTDSKCMILNLNNFKCQLVEIDSALISIQSDKNQNLRALDKENRIFSLRIECDATFKMEMQFDLIYRPIKMITTWCCVRSNIITIDMDGYCRIYNNKELKNEFFVRSDIFNEIKMIEDNKFALISQTGYLTILDIEKESIICEVRVRDTELYGLGIINNNVFCAGTDNRLVSFLFSDSKLFRKSQTDSHCSAVKTIHIDNERIFTISEDCTLAVHKLMEHGYAFRSIIPRYNILKQINNTTFIKNGRNIDIYSIKRIDEHNSMDKLGYYNNNYRHITSLNSQKNILLFDVSEDNNFISYTTSKETILYSMGEKPVKIKTFEPVLDLKFFKKILCGSTYTKSLFFYDITNSTLRDKIILENYDEKMIILNEFILIKGRNLLIDSDLTMINMNININIEHALQIDNKIYIIEFTPNYSINTYYNLGCYDLQTKAYTTLVNIKQVFRLDNMIFIENKIICHDLEKMIIYNLDTEGIKTHHIGKFIMGLGIFNGGLILAQKPLKDILTHEETNKRIKIKWNRKLINK